MSVSEQNFNCLMASTFVVEGLRDDESINSISSTLQYIFHGDSSFSTGSLTDN